MKNSGIRRAARATPNASARRAPVRPTKSGSRPRGVATGHFLVERWDRVQGRLREQPDRIGSSAFHPLEDHLHLAARLDRTNDFEVRARGLARDPSGSSLICGRRRASSTTNSCPASACEAASSARVSRYWRAAAISPFRAALRNPSTVPRGVSRASGSAAGAFAGVAAGRLRGSRWWLRRRTGDRNRHDARTHEVPSTPTHRPSIYRPHSRPGNAANDVPMPRPAGSRPPPGCRRSSDMPDARQCRGGPP